MRKCWENSRRVVPHRASVASFYGMGRAMSAAAVNRCRRVFGEQDFTLLFV